MKRTNEKLLFQGFEWWKFSTKMWEKKDEDCRVQERRGQTHWCPQLHGAASCPLRATVLAHWARNKLPCTSPLAMLAANEFHNYSPTFIPAWRVGWGLSDCSLGARRPHCFLPLLHWWWALYSSMESHETTFCSVAISVIESGPCVGRRMNSWILHLGSLGTLATNWYSCEPVGFALGSRA